MFIAVILRKTLVKINCYNRSFYVWYLWRNIFKWSTAPGTLRGKNESNHDGSGT